MPASPLFERLGGTEACRAVVEGFYQSILEDESLSPFFKDTSMAKLKVHQLNFLSIAFTKIPEDLDVEAFLLDKHRSLFDKGLNGDHFDKVATHLVAALRECKVPEDLVEEAAAVVLPLRSVFQKGADLYGKPANNAKSALAAVTLLERLGGAGAVRAAVDGMYTRLLDDPETAVFFAGTNMNFLKQHQVDFMKIAFDQIPKDLDVPALLTRTHSDLFERKGLTEKHFDLVAKFLVESLAALDVAQTLIDEVLGVLGPLRSVFEQGAKDAREKIIASGQD